MLLESGLILVAKPAAGIITVVFMLVICCHC
jgi:hypothetical protein